jgi:outer membrane protein
MRVLLFLLFGICCFSANAQNIKVGFIETEKIIINLSQYQQSIDAISREFEPKKQELLDLFKHIELIRNNIESNNNSENSKSLENEVSQLSDLEKIFKQETEFWQRTMNDKKINLLNKIETLINETIKTFAKENKYDLILYGDVAFASNKVNITQQIIEEIEKR